LKKKFGLTFGGLHQRIVSLVLMFMAVIIGSFAAVSVYHTHNLTNVVEEANEEQEDSIKNVSDKTMHAVLESSMLKTTMLKADIAANDFVSVANDIDVLRTMAQGLFKNKDRISAGKFALPDPSKDGTATAQVLFEEGVDWEHSEYLGVAAHMTDAMLAIYKGSDNIDGCYIGLADGTHLGIDDSSANRFDENGKQVPFPVRQRPWYVGAVEEGDIYFTGIERDAFSGNINITCSAPVIVDGTLYGVVGMDIVLESMEDFMTVAQDTGAFACIVNENGQIILAPDNNGLFEVMTADKAEDLRISSNRELADFISSALNFESKLDVVNMNDSDYYMACAPMDTIGWSVITVISKEITEQPANAMLTEYERINDDATEKYYKAADRARRAIVLVIIGVTIIGIVSAFYVANRIVRPIEKMTKTIVSLGETEQQFMMDDAYRTGDEIEVLAKAFADISEKTVKYIEQITTITAEKQRISAELDVATQIQADMLPRIFPPYPERAEFDIYADMNPAKEVGGDFYDFFLVDDDHLALVMADVSGKGIPAALFMVIAKTLIKNRTMMGGTPAQILSDVNEQLCEGNEADMFVTVWLSIVDLRTGEGIAANAGHEYPAIYRAGGKYELVKSKHSPAVAVMEGMKFREHEFRLGPGDTLFVYTDGVPEATNNNEEMFGTDRMLEVLNNNLNMPLQHIIDTMRSEIEIFVGDAEQFDDLTMLTLRYYGSDNTIEEKE